MALSLCLALSRFLGGSSASFSVSLTGLTGGFAIIGSHASIGYTITPDNGTDTVKWSNSVDPADPATYGTGVAPTDYTAGDGNPLYCHVTDGGETVTKSATIAYAAGTAPAVADGQSWTVDDTAVNIDASASGANLTFSYVMSGEPAGSDLTINSSTGAITGTLAYANVGSSGSGTITVMATDQYGRTLQDTFTYSYALRSQATGGADLDLSFPEDSAITATDLKANWTANGNTLTYAITGTALPTGLSVSSAGSMTGTPTTITADATYTLRGTDEYGRITDDTFTLEITAAASAATIASTSFDDSSDTWTLTTDQPSSGNWHWARYADGTTSITPDGSGGWSSAPQESGTIAVGASGASLQVPETGTTGTPYELFLYQRNSSSVDSNVLTTGYIADNTAPTVSSAATDVAGDTITITTTETVSGTPLTSDFSFSGITAGTPTINSVTVSGTSITIEISGNLVANGDTVTVSYTQGANKITDAHGNPVATFSGQAVTNNVPSGATAPSIVDATASGVDSDSATSVTVSGYTHGAGTNRKVIVVAGGFINPITGITLSATYGGTAMEEVATVQTGTFERFSMFQILEANLPGGGSGDVVVTASSTVSDLGAAVFTIKDAEQVAVASMDTPTTAGAASGSITPSAANSLVIGLGHGSISASGANWSAGLTRYAVDLAPGAGSFPYAGGSDTSTILIGQAEQGASSLTCTHDMSSGRPGLILAAFQPG